MIILLFVIGNYLTFVIPANAEGISLAVDPPIFQINATPPAKIESPLTIENRGDSIVNLKVNFKPFIPSDREDGQIKYVNEEIGLDVKLIDPTSSSGQAIGEFELSPNQKRNFNLLINIPSDLKASDYYFSIIFLTGKNSKADINSSESTAGIASNVLLSVGEGIIKGEISEFSTPFFSEKGPIPFTVRVKNTSNHFINPKGEILIKNLFGQTIGRVDLAKVNILAGSVRNIPSQDYFDENKNLPDNPAAYWSENFLLGPYKATLSIALSDTGPLFKRSVFFFAFPVKGLVALLLGALVLIYITIRVRSKV